jgi:hypothetical protein
MAAATRQPYLLFLGIKKALMRTLYFIGIAFIFFLNFSCTPGPGKKEVELTPEQLTQQKIDSLKLIAQNGDLLTRMNDNIISFHLKNFNLADKSFSHAGVIVVKDGQKLVCNIDANEKGFDTVRYDPIDSFIDPKENYICGLFRYQLSETEKQEFVKGLNSYHDRKAHFDRVFDLDTDSLVYCSEMISKSLSHATQGRFTFKPIIIPRYMLPVITRFFENDSLIHIPKKTLKTTVAERNYIPIDALYMVPGCTELMRFKLKHFPGDEPQ